MIKLCYNPVMLKKINLIFVAIFLLFSVVFYFSLRHYYAKESMQRIEQALLFDEAIRDYVATHQKTAIDTLKKQGILPHNYFDPTFLSSTFITNHINTKYKELLEHSLHNTNHNIAIKILSDNPLNLKNKTDAREKKILQLFRERKNKEYREEISVNGVKMMLFAEPIDPNDKSCLQCHGDPKDAPKQMRDIYGTTHGFGEKADHIRGMIAIYNPVDEDRANMMQFFYLVELLALFATLGILFTVHYYTNILRSKDLFIAKQTKFAAMGEMISMIAHQWRQPLTGMGMTIENLKLDIELGDVDEKRWEGELETLSEQIHYLSGTIDNFKNFFRPNQKVQTFDVAKFMDESLMLIASTFKSHGINIIKNYTEGLSVTTHKNDLTQIVLNIVKNAKDAYVLNDIKTSRDIEIATYSESDSVIISIKDYAGGIPDEIIEKIFDPYFSTKDEKNGTGLGLYMSKMIIEEHLHGSLDVMVKDNTTTFIIKIINIQE